MIFDLGGVVYPSPFEAFDAYDHANALTPGTVRALIRRSSEEGAWASLERGELSIDEFAVALEAEAQHVGFVLVARKLMAQVGAGLGPRPEMVNAIIRIRAQGLRTAALTNNWPAADSNSVPNALHRMLTFDTIVESALEPEWRNGKRDGLKNH